MWGKMSINAGVVSIPLKSRQRACQKGVQLFIVRNVAAIQSCGPQSYRTKAELAL